MKRVLVIADDLSGAAEIAGIAARFGLPTRLLRGRADGAYAGATVIDTDSRGRSVSDAAAIVRRCIADVRAGDFDLVFKKTDSVFRGHILAESEAILDRLGDNTAVLVPQNPSRGRTIEQGRYFVDGVPLDQTAFANDPVHPVRSADVLELLGHSDNRVVRSAEALGILPSDQIIIGSARTTTDVQRWAITIARDTALPVGGADFFKAILEARGLGPVAASITRLPGGPRLFICGSASRQGEALIARAHAAGIEVCAMPDSPEGWHRTVVAAMRRKEIAVATIGRQVDSAPGAAKTFERVLADLAQRVLGEISIQHLFLEGGATASAICHRMGWNELEICGELATGVVQMRAGGGQSLVVKPGSYPWPDAVWH